MIRFELRKFNSILVALLAGFIGGRLQLSTTHAASDQTLRVQRIDLVDKVGRIFAFLGSTNGTAPGLHFLDGRGTEVLSLGVRSTGLPFLEFLGADSKIRLALQLNGSRASPLLAMGDRGWEGRVLLGSMPSDVQSGADEDWGLVFRAPQAHTDIVSLGAIKEGSSEKQRGRLTLLDSDGKYWTVP